MGELKVLVGSPVNQSPPILKEFLLSLGNIDSQGLILDFIFIDDNRDGEAKDMLRNFKYNNSNIEIQESGSKDEYICNELTHNWNNNLIWKVADFKNTIISFAIEKNYDYLFLIDSDILINPVTIVHLIKQQKDIISEIFWTKWRLRRIELPQVWLYDEYKLYEVQEGIKLTRYEVDCRIGEFIDRLKVPGIYKVGGLGASTLISKKALNSGLSFAKIPNLSFWGEDRHFSIRAAVLGFELYVDTNYPAYHIYRKSQLPEVEEFKKKCGYCVE